MCAFQYGGNGAGDGTGWSSERGDSTTPGGGDVGHSGDHESTGNSGTTGSNAGGNWANSGPLNSALINNAILEALRNGLPRGTIAATSTNSYKLMRAAFDALPVDQQPAARDQINLAWQRAHDVMPDTYSTVHDSGVNNSHSVTVTKTNAAKQTQAQAVSQVKSDVNTALSQNQSAYAEAKAIADKLAAEAAEKKRLDAIEAAKAAGSHMSVSDALANTNSATADAANLSKAAQDAIISATQKRQAAIDANVSATNAEKSRDTLMARAGGTIYKGKYGRWVTRTTGSKNEHTTTTFASNGITVAQVEAAKSYAAQQRALANQLATDATTAENASAHASVEAQNAEIRRQVAEAALASARLAAERAAEAEKQRQEMERAAEEAKRLAEKAEKEAEAAKLAAEQARMMEARQKAADKLNTGDVQSVRGIPLSASVEAVPFSWAVAARGGISLGLDVAGDVSSRIALALAELRGIATASLAGPVAMTIVGILWSKEVGSGSDIVPGRDVSALMPGDALSLPDSTTLTHAADNQTGIAMPVRGRMVMNADGTLETQLVRTNELTNVPVVRAVLDIETGYWGYALPTMPGVPAQTILVSPSDAPGVNGSLTLTGPVPLPEKIMHTGDQVITDSDLTVTVTPVADELDINDLILIFPVESELKPLYVMWRSRRNMPGTASGDGKPVGDNWLNSASNGEGAPIPSHIADKLRDREFGSFDSFRRAFWKEIASDPELSKQFNNDDIELMKHGYAPIVRFKDRVGKRMKIELHHKVEIYKGGDVYNVDNLNALTPKRHIEVHKGN